MKKHSQKGSLTVEAAIVLSMFIVGYVAITAAADFIRAQMIIQYGISQAAKEISGYCYLVKWFMKDSKELSDEAEAFKKDTDQMIDSVVKLYGAVSDGADTIGDEVNSLPDYRDLDNLAGLPEDISHISNVTQEEFNAINSAANAVVETGEAYFQDPMHILKGLGSVVKDEGLSAVKSYAIAAPISKALVRKQVDLYGNDSQGRDILERLGVKNGVSGLNFTGSSLFNDGETITVQVSYSMEIPFPGLREKPLHFIQRASTRAWGASED